MSIRTLSRVSVSYNQAKLAYVIQSNEREWFAQGESAHLFERSELWAEAKRELIEL